MWFSDSVGPVSYRFSLSFCSPVMMFREMFVSRGFACVGWSSGGFASLFSLVEVEVSVCSVA